MLFQQTERQIQVLPPSIPSTSSSILASKIPSTISSHKIRELADCRVDEKALTAGDHQGAMDSEDYFAKESWNNPSLLHSAMAWCYIFKIGNYDSGRLEVDPPF